MGSWKVTLKMKTAAALLLVASASAPQFGGIKSIFKALTGDDEAGEVNGDYETVPYTTLKKYDGYEMRQYPSVKWVCTELTYPLEEEDAAARSGEESEFDLLKNVQEMMSGKAWKRGPQSGMFMKLFRYISGVNKEGEEVEMTVPVINTMTFKEGDQMNKQMCFYLNKKHQANPPTPVDPAVKIEENKEFTVYVHTFGGYAMKDAVNIEQAKIFAEVLKATGEDVDTSPFYSAGYDSPMKFWNRRNEVMYLVPGNKLPNDL